MFYCIFKYCGLWFVTSLKGFNKHLTFNLYFNNSLEHKSMAKNFQNVLFLVIFNAFLRYEFGIWTGITEITNLWKIYPTIWKMNPGVADWSYPRWNRWETVLYLSPSVFLILFEICKKWSNLVKIMLLASKWKLACHVI